MFSPDSLPPQEPKSIESLILLFDKLEKIEQVLLMESSVIRMNVDNKKNYFPRSFCSGNMEEINDFLGTNCSDEDCEIMIDKFLALGIMETDGMDIRLSSIELRDYLELIYLFGDLEKVEQCFLCEISVVSRPAEGFYCKSIFDGFLEDVLINSDKEYSDEYFDETVDKLLKLGFLEAGQDVLGQDGFRIISNELQSFLKLKLETIYKEGD